MGKSDTYQSWISILARHQLDLKGTLVGDIFQMVGDDELTKLEDMPEVAKNEVPMGTLSRMELAIATLIDEKEGVLEKELKRVKGIRPENPSKEDLDVYAQEMHLSGMLSDEINALYTLLYALIGRRLYQKLTPESTGFGIRKNGVIVMLYHHDYELKYPTVAEMLD